jgi:hypothetical protein
MVKPLVTRYGEHSPMRASDTLVDGRNRRFFVNGSTPLLNLAEYHNTTPAEGDIWRYQGNIWVRIGGQTRALFPESSSSMSASSLGAISSSSSSSH